MRGNIKTFRCPTVIQRPCTTTYITTAMVQCNKKQIDYWQERSYEAFQKKTENTQSHSHTFNLTLTTIFTVPSGEYQDKAPL